MKWTFALFVAGVVLVIGCGGGGGGSAGNRTPTDQTRNRLDTSLDVSWKAMIQSGIHTPAFADRRNEGGGTTGGGTGGVGGGMAMPMVGAFFRNFHGGGFLSPGGRDTEPGTSGGSGGDEPPPWNSFYYDEYLGLWVQVDFTEGSFSFLLYEDEAKTQPAGHMTSTWPTDWTTYPQTIESSYEFRAGFLAGSSGSYVVTMTNDSTGTMTYTNIGNDGSSSSGTSTWAAGGSNWQNEATLRDGKWFKDRGAFQADGSGQTQSENSLGYKWTMNWSANGSGSGRIEGPDPGLPASLVCSPPRSSGTNSAKARSPTPMAVPSPGTGSMVSGITGERPVAGLQEARAPAAPAIRMEPATARPAPRGTRERRAITVAAARPVRPAIPADPGSSLSQSWGPQSLLGGRNHCGPGWEVAYRGRGIHGTVEG